MIEDLSWINDGQPFKAGDERPFIRTENVNRFIDIINSLVYTINKLEEEIDELKRSVWPNQYGGWHD